VWRVGVRLGEVGGKSTGWACFPFEATLMEGNKERFILGPASSELTLI
jgi:hypothetical protein